ncbi:MULTISPECIES: GvpL/GvpF family gas vesicle protein [Streptomyces]|uniref:GvpL/GvpF family gas vesicle protein n=1 Tax=Streptomyces TaxID=1883 RepID=UPI000CD5774C|nr:MULTISPECIES: GvpL/GvpF family gas vesicle protein [Streptomyces]
MTEQIYTYGIVRTGHRLPSEATGVGNPPERLRALSEGPLTIIVSRAPGGLLARRRDLLAHQETLLALASEGPVIPMRFGSVAPDEDTLRRRLTESPEEKHDALKRLDGRVEMNLKALVVEDSLPTLVREDARIRRLHQESRSRPGYESSLRLGQAVAEGLARRATQAAARTVEQVRALAEAMSPGPEVEGCVLNMSFLLPREREGAFRTAVDRFVAEYRGQAELRLSGPLPCFSFTDPPPRARHRPRASRPSAAAVASERRS